MKQSILNVFAFLAYAVILLIHSYYIYSGMQGNTVKYLFLIVLACIAIIAVFKEKTTDYLFDLALVMLLMAPFILICFVILSDFYTVINIGIPIVSFVYSLSIAYICNRLIYK